MDIGWDHMWVGLGCPSLLRHTPDELVGGGLLFQQRPVHAPPTLDGHGPSRRSRRIATNRRPEVGAGRSGRPRGGPRGGEAGGPGGGQARRRCVIQHLNVTTVAAAEAVAALHGQRVARRARLFLFCVATTTR